jgi:putative SOS response-associated peptidase YedK
MIPYSCDDGAMCGRYASTKVAADIASEFRATDATRGVEPGPAYNPDYNVAPTKPVLAVVQRHPRDADGALDLARTERSVRVMRWGLVPSWAKDPAIGSRMINARAETAADKPTYRKALAARRCLLPADGWYEWKRHGQHGRATQPYFVTGANGASLAMAGLWEFWRSPDGSDSLVTTAVLTTDAVGPLADIHQRMPLLLTEDAWADWLDPDVGSAAEEIVELLAPPSDQLVSRLELRPVSTRVNSVRNNGPELLALARPEPVPAELALDLN